MTASLTARIWASGIRARIQNCVIGIFGFEVVYARENMRTDLMISRTGIEICQFSCLSLFNDYIALFLSLISL